MPRYYFNATDVYAQRDRNGTALPDISAARIEAVRLSSILLSEQLAAARVSTLNETDYSLRAKASLFWKGEEWTMRVSDETDLTLFTLVFTAEGSPAASRWVPGAAH
jgi:hypothetical protein